MNTAFKQAPRLCFTRGKLKNSKNPSYFGWEPELWKYINKELSGKEGNCIKLINILLGTAEGFSVSQKWICEMAGLSKDGYYKARKKLEEKGMLIYDDKANTITIDTKGMLETYSQKEEKEGMFETYSQGISETYSKGMLETYPESISETYHNKEEQKIKQKKETEKRESFSARAEKSSNPLPTISKEKREKLMSASKTEGMGEFFEEWFNKGGTTVYPSQEWKGL